MENKKIVVYSTPTCPYCDMAKAFLDEKGMTYESYDVSTDLERRKEMMEKTGQLGVPVISIGEDTMVGFDQSKIAELLGM